MTSLNVFITVAIIVASISILIAAQPLTLARRAAMDLLRLARPCGRLHRARIILVFGVGLSTTNLGTLSRYRAPMMPFYLLLILSLSLPYTTTSARRATRR